MFLLDKIMPGAMILRRLEYRRPVDLAGAKGYTRLLLNRTWIKSSRFALADVLQMHQGESPGVALQHLRRVLVAEQEPENIHFEVSEFGIHTLCQGIEQRSIGAAHKLGAVRVIAETQARTG